MRAMAFLVAALLAGPALGFPFEVEELPAAEGQPRVILAPRAGPRAALVVSFAAGSVDDGNRAGLVRLAQHALLSANQRLAYGPFLLDVYASAGELAVETDPRDSAFVLEADGRDFTPLATRLLQALLAPRLDPARWHLAVARTVHDGHRPGGGGNLHSFVASIVIEDTRYRNEPYGDPDQIDLIGRAEVERELRSRLSPANATVVVAGAFDRGAIVRALRGLRGGSPAATPPPRLALPFATRRAADREIHVLAHPMKIESARDAAVARVLGAAVEDELWRRFRQAGVGYSFTVLPARTPWLDLFVVVLPAHDPSSIDLAPYLKESLERVAGGKLDDARLAAARTVALARLRAVDEDPTALAGELAAGGASWHGAAVAQAIASLDRAAFLETASRWLAPESAIQLYFGPPQPGSAP
jgi:hypothetical protein